MMRMEHLAAIGLLELGRRSPSLAATPDMAAAAASPPATAARHDNASAGGGGNAGVSGGSSSEASGRDVFTNFVQYGLPLPEVVVCDNSMRPWRSVRRGWCDCIVTDPPYGIRAAAKKQGRSNPSLPQEGGSRQGPVEIRDCATYIPPKVNYGDDELAADLLRLAAEALRDGGRLVFLVPVDLADFLGIDRAASERGEAGGEACRSTLHGTAMPKGGRKKKDPRLCVSETSRDPLLLNEDRYRDFLPEHADLELVGASLQVLSGGLGRLLVTMRRRPRQGCYTPAEKGGRATGWACRRQQ